MHPPLGILQDALDLRLAGPARIEVDEHLAACDVCRRRLHALRWTKVRLAGVGSSLVMPPWLEAEIRRLLDPEARRPVATPAPLQAERLGAGWRRWFEWWRGRGTGNRN